MMLEDKNSKSLSNRIKFDIDEYGELVGPPQTAPVNTGEIPAPLPLPPVSTAPFVPAKPVAPAKKVKPPKPAKVKPAAKVKPRPSRLPAAKEQVVLWWGGILFGLVLLGLGGFLWFYGNVKTAEQVPLPAIDVKTLTLREPALPASQRASFNLNYAAAVNAFNNGQPGEAASYLEPIVAVAPTFNKDAAAFLLLAYRATALDKMGDQKTEADAIHYFDAALNLKDEQPDALLVEFKQKPGLLPPGTADLTALVNDLTRQKQWFELYRQGESYQENKEVNWFDNAVTPWRAIYDENRTFLKDKGNRWVALRLLAAYQAQSTYNCKTNKDYNKARRSLIDARGITVDNNLVSQRNTIDKKLAEIADQGCN